MIPYADSVDLCQYATKSRIDFSAFVLSGGRAREALGSVRKHA